jgi:dTDP-4-amino-4,6-dideoxygalactose transaminase
MSYELSRRAFVLGTAVPAASATLRLSANQSPTVAVASKPAVLGGKPLRTGRLPDWPIIEQEDRNRFLAALERREWCRLGAQTTTDFEEEWARRLGARYAIGVVNGTSALYAALNALEVGPGDEVLVPPYTFVATVNAVFQQFALPVFVDTDFETQQMDPAGIERAVTEHTRCIIPVHLGGNVADMGRILTTAERLQLPVVEDACQAHLAEWNGKAVGTLGAIGCFSFQASKILPCGEGGAVVTSREDLYDRMHAFQNNGRDRKTGTRHGYLHQGGNLRMTEYQAALLQAQLTRLEEQCRIREQRARHLTQLLAQVGGMVPARMYPGCTRNTWYIYLARYDADRFKGLSRAGFLKAMQAEGIPLGPGYQPLNREPFIETLLQSRAFTRIFSADRLRRYREQNRCPVNDRLCEQGLFLSQRVLLAPESEVELVAAAVERIQRHAEEIARVT